MTDVIVRAATLADLPRLTEIHNWYVEHSHATFDEQPVTIEERGQWFETYGSGGRYRLLVAEADGTVLGCAYSSPYRSHPAFSRTAETGIYLGPEARGQGVGRQLYSRLLTILAGEQLHVLVAGVALPNPASLRLHLSSGFREVGTFEQYATKRNQPISSTWFQRPARP